MLQCRMFKKPSDLKISQLDLGIERAPEQDRNHHLGGRSFYFFDFDDNIAFLSTPLILFNKIDGSELQISSGEFAQFHHTIGKTGPYRDYQIDYCDRTGTFQKFRDHHIDELEKLEGKRQVFVEDVAHALGFPDFHWKGPSWECFYHAAFNQRPISVITARGHTPQTLQEGIDLFVEHSFLPARPNYLSIFPVSHTETRRGLGDHSLQMSVAELKQKAIRASVEIAIEKYGHSPHHRFGMSDDDPKNVQLIIEEMRRLKSDYPEMSFFVIETQKGEFIKHEVAHNETKNTVNHHFQMSLFDKA